MKAGWERKRLDEVCYFTNGLWKGEKPPLLTIGVIRNTNFTKDGALDDSDIAYIEVEAKKFEKRRLQFGDIILEKSGGGPKQPVGRVALFDKEDGDFSFSNFTAALRVKDADALNFRYLHKYLFWIHQSGLTEGIQSHSTGIRNLDGDAYKAIEIPVPPLAEQQRIVGVLDEAFAGLATAQARAAQNLQNARALFESHLQSVFIQRGNGWVEKTLKDVCEEIFAGGDVPKDRLSEERTAKYSVPIYSNGEKNAGLYGFTDIARVTKPSITVSARGTLGFTAIRAEPFLPVVRLIVLIPDDKQIMLSFLYYAIVGMDFGNTGTSIPQLTVPNFKESKLHIPSLPEQEAIIAQLDALAAETQNLARLYEQKLAALAELKKSLLHQAFSGEL